jgi:tryptophan-rich sensory protein
VARSWEVGQSERALRWRAFRALAVALVLFVVYVLLQWKLRHLDILAIDIILERLDILIWVALWFPLDALFFGLQSYDVNSGSYRRASQMQLKIEPA